MAKKTEQMASKAMGAMKAAKARVKGLEGVFKTLTKEHGEASALLKRIGASSDSKVRADLFPEVRKELLAHERGELRELYPVLRERSETRDIAEEHDREAGELEELLDTLLREDAASPSWQPTFDRLVALVEHHTSEEEKEYFPRAQEALGKEAASTLDERYHAAKENALREMG